MFNSGAPDVLFDRENIPFRMRSGCNGDEKDKSAKL